MRIRYGWMVSNAALLTYVIPASFLAISFYRIMGFYGLSNNLWSVIAAEVTFATPYAIFIFQQYGVSIPIELDEAARIDGASPAGQRGGPVSPRKVSCGFRSERDVSQGRTERRPSRTL
jgi:ABC-type glycerol-3-phosphate transport system permease component